MTDAAGRDAGRRDRAWANVVPLLMGLLDFPYGLFIRLYFIVGGSRLPAKADTPRRRRRGLTIVLGGIEGPSFYNAQIVRGLLASGYRGAVVRCDWNAGVPFLRSFTNLMSRRHHERHARAVVDLVSAYQAEHPCAPISIVAQSGGCWVAVRAMELMPASIRVSTVTLHAAAISPDYDLSAAAGRCQHAMISVEAFGDYVLLGIGTLLFGTSDRRHRLAGGFVGFRNRPPKLVAMRWRPSWLDHGHWGNHTTSASFAFMRDLIGPVLLTRRGGTALASSCEPVLPVDGAVSAG